MIITTNHFKIWFSKDKEIWLPLENQLRLIRHREKNPLHTIYLVGADRLLSNDCIQKRKDFCSKFNIIYLDLDNDIPSIIEKESAEIRKNDDLKLLQLANDQIDKFFSMNPMLSREGNLAAASDLVRWLSVLLKRGIYSDLDTEIDFRNVPNQIDSDFLIPCRKVWEGILINNNFIAASETSELADFIRKRLINAEKLINTLDYSHPQRWVHLLYGPEPIRSAICEYFGLNERLEDKSVEEYDALALKIVSQISTTPHKLFQDEKTHGMGAGDVSWATDSQETASKKLLHAASMIARLWKRKKEASLSNNNQIFFKPASSDTLPVVGEVESEEVINPTTIPDKSPKCQPVDENKLKIQMLRENINLAILGMKVVNYPKTELPADNVKSYLSWMNKHATGIRGLTRFSHWYHGASGVKRARDLLEVANDTGATFEEILNQLKQTFDNSSKRRHSLSRYLMAQFSGEAFENLKQMDDDKFDDKKSGYRLL